MQIRVGGPIALVIALVVAGFVFWQVKSATNTANDAIKAAGVNGDIVGVANAPKVKASDPSSLYKTANLEKALAAAEKTLGADAQVSDFKLEPGRLSVIGSVDGKDVMVLVAANDKVSSISTPGPSSNTIALASVDPKGAARLIAAAKEDGVAIDQVTYLVADAGIDAQEAPQWLLYTTGTGHYAGDIHGAGVKKIG